MSFVTSDGTAASSAVLLAGLLMAYGLWQRPAPSRGAADRQTAHPAVVGFPLLILGAWWFESVVLLVAVPFVASMVVTVAARVRRRLTREQLDAAVVTFTEDLSQQLRSGGALTSSFLSTLDEHPIVGDRLKPVIAAASAGVRLELALDQTLTLDRNPVVGAWPPAKHSRRTEHPDSLRLLAAAVAVLTQNGGPAAPSLERLTETMRANLAARAEARVQASQAIASATVLAALPIMFVVVYAVIDHDVIDFYFHTLFGGICLFLMLGLTATSILWIEVVVGRDL